MSDSELLNRLEAAIKREPLVLWDGVGDFPGRASRLSGLALLGGRRTLRQAIEQMCPAAEPTSPAPQEQK